MPVHLVMPPATAENAAGIPSPTDSASAPDLPVVHIAAPDRRAKHSAYQTASSSPIYSQQHRPVPASCKGSPDTRRIWLIATRDQGVLPCLRRLSFHPFAAIGPGQEK